MLLTTLVVCLAVLFKLQQMQAIDRNVLSRLFNRFTELGGAEKGFLVIGEHVPSAAMVDELKKNANGRPLTQMWKEMQVSANCYFFWWEFCSSWPLAWSPL